MNWTKKYPRETNVLFVQAVSRHLSSSGPVSAWLNQLVQDGDFRSVVDFNVDYTASWTLPDLIATRQIQALFSKQEEDWIGYGANMEQVAYKAFCDAEKRCEETNRRLESKRPNGLVSVVSHHACRKISSILGNVVSFQLLDFSYGPGATTNVKSAEACAIAKLSARPVCSEELLPCVGEFLAEFPYLAEHHCVKDSGYFPLFEDDPDYLRHYVEVQVGTGKLVFVNKNIKTKRPIVVEPILNGLGQKGIGTYIRKRLLDVANLDLKDQERNRKLSRLGSIDGSLATVDLSSASDTLSIGTVFELLPPEWVDLLGLFRTGKVTYGHKLFDLHKWSSMGNGYTFELESLIFWGLAQGCCEALSISSDSVSVFGDDIIIPTEAYPLLEEVLTWYGFSVNMSKSFSSGPFRESCGADWFVGDDVRPFYLKEKLSDRVLYVFFNWAMRRGERELAELILSFTRPSERLYGPDGYGDGHLLGSYSLIRNRMVRRCGWEGGYFHSYRLRQRRLEKRRPGDWVYPGYSVYTRTGLDSETDPFITRGSAGYEKISIYTLASTIFCG